MNYFGKNIIWGLLILILVQSVFSYSMEQPGGADAYRELINAIWDGDINEIKFVLANNKLDINRKTCHDNFTLIIEAIDKAISSCEGNKSDYGTRLQIIELLIQTGAKINEKIKWEEYSALEYVVMRNIPSLLVIKLLLAYGAKITQRVLEEVSEKSNKNEIMAILTDYQQILEQSLTNPTKSLLAEAIRHNQPYIVQLITVKKLELVTQLNIDTAKIFSPGSMPILENALKVIKFRKLAAEQKLPREMPVELAGYIEKFVLG